MRYVNRTTGEGGKLTLTAAVASPGALRSEARFVDVVGAGAAFSIKKKCVSGGGKPGEDLTGKRRGDSGR